MDAKEIRQKFLEFFKEKGHAIIPSASLVPEHDPTVLFTTAGMHPLVPYLLGEKHPGGKKVANVQICLRTDDIDEIGDNRHLTFFEMLGNWSFGDPASPDGIGGASYFKKETIEWSFEFLTDRPWLNLDPRKIYISVFEGDQDAPRDEESIKTWQEQFAKIGIKAEVGNWKEGIKDNARIFMYGKEKNWWGPAGKEGPCGPDTEIFYDIGAEHDPVFGEVCHPNCDCGRFIELWNDVFMEYSKTKDGKYEPLRQKNVDTGLGLERLAAVMENKKTLFETELFKPIIDSIKNLAGIKESVDSFNKLFNPAAATNRKLEGLKKEAELQIPLRIIADHLRAATFVLAENIEPSNVERGYVLRRLIRRAIRYGKQIGISSPFAHKIAEVVIGTYKDIYSQVKKNKDFIFEQLIREEEKYNKAREKAIKDLKKIYGRFIGGIDPENLPKGLVVRGNKIRIKGEEVFHIYETSGLPIEEQQEIMAKWGIEFDEQTMKEAREAFEKHQEISRAGAEQKFKGGLAEHSEITTKYHTATHLLLAALRRILGDHVLQRGSNITAERLRFDFSHPQKITQEQIKEVENLVNQKIGEQMSVKMEEMTLEEAKASGAIGVFEQKYGEKVKVYIIFSPQTGEVFSKEICGGPHINNLKILGKFKIVKEEASSAGVRRIKAILE